MSKDEQLDQEAARMLPAACGGWETIFFPWLQGLQLISQRAK
jgi:hypothetical protein